MRVWSWELDSTTSAVAAARGHVLSVLADEPLTADAVDDAALVVSEVVTNSVVHGRPPILVTLTNIGSHWQLRVHDGERSGPSFRPTSLTAEGGRGMRLVAIAGQRWGVDRMTSDGKDVWVDLI